MDSPLLVLLPLILILALPAYIVMRDRRRSNEEMAQLETRGFNADVKFDMHDMYVALDNAARKIAFVNVKLQCFPPDRGSYFAHFTIVEPYSNLDRIEVQYSDKLILIDVTFQSPNTFNSSRKMSFDQAPQSKSKLQELIAAWPGVQSKQSQD